MAKKRLWYAEQKQVDTLTKKLGYKRTNVYIDYLNFKRIQQRAKHKQRLTDPNRNLRQFLQKGGKLERETTRLKNVNKEIKWAKTSKLIASILLPLLFFTALGISLGAFFGMVKQGNTYEIIDTPMDKLIEIGQIISDSGEEIKYTISASKLDFENQNIKFPNPFKLGDNPTMMQRMGYLRELNTWFQYHFKTNNFTKIFGFLIQLVWQPIKITFRIVGVLFE